MFRVNSPAYSRKKKRKVIRNGNKKEINANIKHTIQTKIGSIITIKKSEKIFQRYFLYIFHVCIMPNTHTKETLETKKTFHCKNFWNKLPEATTTRSNMEYVNNNDIFISIFFMFSSHRHTQTVKQYIRTYTVLLEPEDKKLFSSCMSSSF